MSMSWYNIASSYAGGMSKPRGAGVKPQGFWGTSPWRCSHRLQNFKDHKLIYSQPNINGLLRLIYVPFYNTLANYEKLKEGWAA